jgi:hypothetical protein
MAIGGHARPDPTSNPGSTVGAPVLRQKQQAFTAFPARSETLKIRHADSSSANVRSTRNPMPHAFGTAQCVLVRVYERKGQRAGRDHRHRGEEMASLPLTLLA